MGRAPVAALLPRSVAGARRVPRPPSSALPFPVPAAAALAALPPLLPPPQRSPWERSTPRGASLPGAGCHQTAIGRGRTPRRRPQPLGARSGLAAAFCRSVPRQEPPTHPLPRRSYLIPGRAGRAPLSRVWVFCTSQRASIVQGTLPRRPFPGSQWQRSRGVAGGRRGTRNGGRGGGGRQKLCAHPAPRPAATVAQLGNSSNSPPKARPPCAAAPLIPPTTALAWPGGPSWPQLSPTRTSHLRTGARAREHIRAHARGTHTHTHTHTSSRGHAHTQVHGEHVILRLQAGRGIWTGCTQPDTKLRRHLHKMHVTRSALAKVHR